MNIPKIFGIAVFISCSTHMAHSQVFIEQRPFRAPQAPHVRPPSNAVSEQPFELPIDAKPSDASKNVAAVVVAPINTLTPPVQPAPVVPTWEIRLADNNLSRALMRWAAAAPDKLPVVWEATKDLPAVAARYQGEFLTAIEQVMRDTANSQYPLHACAHDNVVRVLHVSQPCVRSAATISGASISTGAE